MESKIGWLIKIRRAWLWLSEKWIAARGGRMPGDGSAKLVVVINGGEVEPFLIDFRKGETVIAVERRLRICVAAVRKKAEERERWNHG